MTTTNIHPVIMSFCNIFRSSYGSTIDIVDTPMAIYHDALHALTGIGISATEEGDILIIESFLREDPVHRSDLEMVLSYLELIPEELLEEIKTFYMAN